MKNKTLTLNDISFDKKYQLLNDNFEIGIYNDIETVKTAMVFDMKNRYGLVSDPSTNQNYLLDEYRIIEVLVPKIIT